MGGCAVTMSPGFAPVLCSRKHTGQAADDRKGAGLPTSQALGAVVRRMALPEDREELEGRGVQRDNEGVTCPPCCCLKIIAASLEAPLLASPLVFPNLGSVLSSQASCKGKLGTG